MHNLSYTTAFSILKNIKDYVSADFDAIGITDHEFDLVTGNKPWRRTDIRLVMRTLNAMLFSSLEQLGISKIVVPAEYVAALVAAAVSPANRMPACCWLAQERQTGVGALELSARNQQASSVQPCSADALFALVCELSNNDSSNKARAELMQALGREIAKAQKGVKANV